MDLSVLEKSHEEGVFFFLTGLVVLKRGWRTITLDFCICLFAFFLAWLAGWLVGWLAGCLVGWLVGWLAGWLVGW